MQIKGVEGSSKRCRIKRKYREPTHNCVEYILGIFRLFYTFCRMRHENGVQSVEKTSILYSSGGFTTLLTVSVVS